jgi:hypothetical protein
MIDRRVRAFPQRLAAVRPACKAVGSDRAPPLLKHDCVRGGPAPGAETIFADVIDGPLAHVPSVIRSCGLPLVP